MLTVHHLGISQSERIVWLCEELELEYALKRYDRRADNRLAPDDYKALHPMGIAPVITDGDLVLGESGSHGPTIPTSPITCSGSTGPTGPS
jgi:glutathione S-transferase